jgi:PAS domain S-box-containing protein
VAQHPVEIILARQLAELLSFPIVLIGVDGTLLFYNEPAEAIIGYRYDEAGELPYAEWTAQVQPVDDKGQPVDVSHRPIPTALREHRPSHNQFRIHRADGGRREIEITGIPLLNQSQELRGTIAIFWEVET